MEINLNSKEDLKIYSNPTNYKDTPLSYLFNKTFKVIDYTGTLIMDDGSDPYTIKDSPIYDFNVHINQVQAYVKNRIVYFKEKEKKIEMYDYEKQTLIANIAQGEMLLDSFITITKTLDQIYIIIDNKKVDPTYQSYYTFVMKEIDAL